MQRVLWEKERTIIFPSLQLRKYNDIAYMSLHIFSHIVKSHFHYDFPIWIFKVPAFPVFSECILQDCGSNLKFHFCQQLIQVMTVQTSSICSSFIFVPNNYARKQLLVTNLSKDIFIHLFNYRTCSLVLILRYCDTL